MGFESFPMPSEYNSKAEIKDIFKGSGKKGESQDTTRKNEQLSEFGKSREEDKINEKIQQLASLINEQKLCELQPKHRSFNAYELESNEKEINNSYDLIEKLISKKDFYTNVAEEDKSKLGGISIPLHSWFVFKLPLLKEDFEDHKEEAQRVIRILKLMEEIKSPDLEYFSEGGEIITEAMKVFPINQEVDVRIVVSRKNRDEIIKNDFKRNTPCLEDNQYNINIFLLDNNGCVIHDFKKDLYGDSVISVGNRYGGGPSSINIPAVGGKLFEKFSSDGIISLAHEIGHNHQFNDEKFRQAYYERKGRYPEESSMDRKDKVSEREAWAYGLRLLRNIEKETGKKILPEFSLVSSEIKKHLTTYDAEYSKKV